MEVITFKDLQMNNDVYQLIIRYIIIDDSDSTSISMEHFKNYTIANPRALLDMMVKTYISNCIVKNCINTYFKLIDNVNSWEKMIYFDWNRSYFDDDFIQFLYKHGGPKVIHDDAIRTLDVVTRIHNGRPSGNEFMKYNILHNYGGCFTLGDSFNSIYTYTSMSDVIFKTDYFKYGANLGERPFDIKIKKIIYKNIIESFFDSEDNDNYNYYDIIQKILNTYKDSKFKFRVIFKQFIKKLTDDLKIKKIKLAMRNTVLVKVIKSFIWTNNLSAYIVV